MTSPKVALIETKPSRTNFKQEFDGAFEFDQFQLCSDPSIKKVLKRDCDIDIDTDEPELPDAEVLEDTSREI